MTALLPGTRVRARALMWEVVACEPAGGEQERVRLRGLEGALQGWELDLLTPLEAIEPVSQALDPERAGRRGPWLLIHQAFVLEQSLGATAFVAAQPGRVEIAPYQLVPVMRALRMSRPRLLLADGVGLGKTIQAGLVITELLARRRAHRVLVVSPAGPLLRQWERELRDRFGLRFQVLTGAGDLLELRRGLTLGANPFDHVALTLASIDFVKQERVLQELERSSWDLAVIDEAHHAARLGQTGDWEDSRRRRLAEVVARVSDGLLLLTATPHDGFDPHFASLVELLDPSLLDGRGALRGDHYRRHVVRRLKQHVRDPASGGPVFPPRTVVPSPVAFGDDDRPAFTALQRSLLALVAPQLRAAVRQRRYGEVLAFVSVLKRSVSTVAACRATLSVVRDRYAQLAASGGELREARRERLRSLRAYQRRLARYGSVSWEDEQDRTLLEAEDMAAELAFAPDELAQAVADAARSARRDRHRHRRVTSVLDALDTLLQVAGEAAGEDPKLDAVLHELIAIRSQEPDTNVLVYSEYTDSQDALVAHLRAAIARGTLTGEVVAISGRPEHAAERERVTDRFASRDGIVLVSTDATAEGLNLQERCHHLIHLELPYNPNRLEQRNGRIDRYGQRRPPHIRYLYLVGTFEERLLLRLVAKYERQRASLTFVPDTLGPLTAAADALDERLLAGLAEEDHALFARPRIAPGTDPADHDDVDTPAYRELLAEVDRALDGYRSATRQHSWLNEAGSHADAAAVAEAERARAAGGHLADVDLVSFVTRALEDDVGADAVARENGELVLRLPPAWRFGLEGLPGADDGRFRLTTEVGRLRDGAGRSLGYLGRAHPMVRRALERARHRRHGDARGELDHRVAAVHWALREPALLATFLVGARSGAGREFERVLAVLAGRDGETRVVDGPGEWLALAADGAPAATAGLWRKVFADWGDDRRTTALALAQRAADRLLADLATNHTADLRRERADLDAWLAVRAVNLTGTGPPQQLRLFAADDAPTGGWRARTDPLDRLSGLATDAAATPAHRQEAAGVVRTYRRRRDDLDRRDDLVHLPLEPLGMLLLVPAREA